MRMIKITAGIALLLPLCGCVPLPSFYPLWDEQHDAFEPRLVGDWKDTDSDEEGALTIAQSKDKTYLVTLSGKEDGKTQESRYEGRLVRLGEHLFLDLIADDKSFEKRLEGESYQSFVLSHFFVRAKLDGDTLKLAVVDDEKFEKRVLKKDIDAPLLKRRDTILLTAETAKIQQVFGRIADDKDLWDEVWTLQRATAR